jgi:hypothetical protein
VNQDKIVHQFYRCGDGQGRAKVARQHVTSYQRQYGLKMLRPGIVFWLPPLVNPAQVIPEQVIQEALPRSKPFP